MLDKNILVLDGHTQTQKRFQLKTSQKLNLITQLIFKLNLFLKPIKTYLKGSNSDISFGLVKMKIIACMVTTLSQQCMTGTISFITIPSITCLLTTHMQKQVKKFMIGILLMSNLCKLLIKIRKLSEEFLAFLCNMKTLLIIQLNSQKTTIPLMEMEK